MSSHGRTTARRDGRRDERRQQGLIGPADHAYALSAVHQRRVRGAVLAIEDAAAVGKIGVSYSGGKDSTCVLHLVRRVVPDAPAAFYDSGCEYPDCYALVQHYGVQTIYPERSLPEMLRLGGGRKMGSWGANPDAPDREFDLFAFLIANPAWQFTQQAQIQVMALGLRGGESAGRRLNARRRGMLYQLAHGRWHLCPLALWQEEDVWAYIAANGLRYNQAYDRMAALGVPRNEMRVGPLIGSAELAYGSRFAILRQIYPDVWRQLAGQFPEIARYT